MTPKAYVLKRCPAAWSHLDGAMWHVYPAPFGPMAMRPKGSGPTAKAAWLEAAIGEGYVPRRKG